LRDPIDVRKTQVQIASTTGRYGRGRGESIATGQAALLSANLRRTTPDPTEVDIDHSFPIVEVFVQFFIGKRPAEVSIRRLDEAVQGY
jgi:hypothetical protein